MIKTKTKKIIAFLSIVTLTTMQFSTAFATSVGQITAETNSGSVTTPVDIDWDENYGGNNNASGAISWIKVTATVEPILDMKLSNTLLELWVISGTGSSASINIEVWTNSPSWVVVTAISQSWGLVNTDTSISDIINSDNGWNYNYTSTDWWWTSDFASGASPTRSFLATTEVNNSTELTVYQSDLPENLSSTIDDITFTVAAKAQAIAAPGSYEDHITFVVTTSF